MNQGGMFANLVQQYGARDEERISTEGSAKAPGQAAAKNDGQDEDGDPKEQSALMQEEERMRECGGVLWIALIIINCANVV